MICASAQVQAKFADVSIVVAAVTDSSAGSRGVGLVDTYSVEVVQGAYRMPHHALAVPGVIRTHVVLLS